MIILGTIILCLILILMLSLCIMFQLLVGCKTDIDYLNHNNTTKNTIKNTIKGGVDISPTTWKNIREISELIDGKTLNPIFNYNQLYSLTYEGGTLVKIGCHLGQRKLLLTEIQFYNTLRSINNNVKLIIYAGSAPAEHMPVLLEMFPDLKFLLIDPHFHRIDAEYIGVYQNRKNIDPKDLNLVKKDLKSSNYSKSNNSISKNSISSSHKRYKNVKNLTEMKFIDGKTYNAIESDMTPNYDSFLTTYQTLISTILKDKHRVYIIQDYMTRKLSELIRESLEIAKYEDIGFVSDIRTNMFGSYPMDGDYIWNDALQLIFMKTLKPRLSMIKFHPPYFAADDKSISKLPQYMADDILYVKDHYKIDMIDMYKNRKYLYVANTIIWLQAWAPVTSSEARLIISEKNLTEPPVEYNHDEWDNKFMYFKLMRGYGFYDRYYKEMSKSTDYDGCFDCTLEIEILLNFILKQSHFEPIQQLDPKYVKDILYWRRKIDKSLLWKATSKCPLHGNLTKPPENLIFYHKSDNLWKLSNHNKMIMYKNGPIYISNNIKYINNIDQILKNLKH